MTSFWFAVVALFIMAGGFIFWPLISFKAHTTPADADNAAVSLKKSNPEGNSKNKSNLAVVKGPADLQKQRNIDIFKERLSELEAECTQGNLDADAFAQLKLELEKSLLNDVALTNDTTIPAETALQAKHWLISTLMTLAVVIASLGLYSIFGRSDDLMRFQMLQAQGLLGTKTAEDGTSSQTQGLDFNKAIALLKEKIKQDPKDPQKWYLLAKSYAATNQYDQAAECFLEIIKLTPKDSPDYAVLKGSYAQSLYLASNEQITPQIKAVIEETLAIDPQEANSLVLKGVEAFQNNQFQQAITTWESAKVKANPDLIEQFISPAIASAQERLGITPSTSNSVASTTTNQAPDKPSNSTAKIEILVDIAPELKDKVTPDQIVFVFARPPDSKMPLAAERLMVKDLPATITLDDSKAAMPTAKLSSAATVDITARISLSGQPMQQPGDLYVTQSEVRVDANESIKLVINQVAGN